MLHRISLPLDSTVLMLIQRAFLTSISPALLTVCMVVLGSNCSDAADRPNVLFIAVDDLRPEIECFGGRGITPNINAFAQSAMRFDRAYCNQAVCGASRLSLMTGLYPEFTNERSFHVTDWRKRWPDVITLNQHFKSSGYETIGLGKIYHGASGPGVDPQNWTNWIRVKGREYADPENLAIQQNSGKVNGKKRGPSTENFETPDDTHADGNRAKVGAAKIFQLAKSDQPFFLAVGFTKPHLPFVAPKKYWDLYKKDQFSMPANLGYPKGYPQFAINRKAGELRSYSDIPNETDCKDFPDELNHRLIHGYHACVSYVDRNIGVLLNALKESGAAENTIVVLWADHGWKLGDHSSWCKHTNFECDTRVPLVIRTPGGSTGQTDALVELIDLYPTLCELCGIDRPTHLQGRSIEPLLSGSKAEHRQCAYSSYAHSQGRGKKGVVGHSIRTPQYRYTEWWERGTDRITHSVLTDLSADPGETTSVSGEKELKQELSEKLRQRVLTARKNAKSPS